MHAYIHIHTHALPGNSLSSQETRAGYSPHESKPGVMLGEQGVLVRSPITLLLTHTSVVLVLLFAIHYRMLIRCVYIIAML